LLIVWQAVRLQSSIPVVDLVVSGLVPFVEATEDADQRSGQRGLG
jgi:hypothetical protein